MKALWTALAFALLLAPFAGAARKKAALTSTAGATRATGTIVSATATSLVISSPKAKQTTYVLNSDTKIGPRLKNKMNPGAEVTVSYHMENGTRVATAVIMAAGTKLNPQLNPQPLPPRKSPTTQ
jgi:hypothetical protein